MSLETDVQALTTSVQDLLTAVNVKKADLDSSATAAGASAAAAETHKNAAAAILLEVQQTADTSVDINHIGAPGAAGFGVGIAPSVALFDGMTPLYGYTDPTHPQYGNYQYSDGSVMCWIPKFYYRIGHASNPTYGVHGVNSLDVKGVKDFPTRFDAEAAGYAMHRAFIDGGDEQDGFFVDKYMASKNAKGAGFVASSIAGGLPLSTAADHNPIADLTACAGNAYYEAINAAHARDGVDGAVNLASRFHVVSRFQWAALALLSLAHGQAATSSTYCAWYAASGTTNFPKGCNNNALGDTNDGAIAYVSDGYSNCGTAGSGTPFAKTTHNGQACGVADVNGLMYDLSIGITCIAGTVAITAASQGNPCQITAVGHGLATGDAVMITSVGGMTQLNDKIFAVTVVDADHFTLDGVDATAFPAYTAGGTVTYGTFYAANEATRMRDFTAGNTLASDHWGATGVAAMMTPISVPFATAYPNNGFVQKIGNAGNQVLDPAASGNGWLLTALGLPQAGGISTAGSNLFGIDYFYQYIRNELFLLSSLAWAYGSSAGVWGLYLYDGRAGAHHRVGFRAACYPGA